MIAAFARLEQLVERELQQRQQIGTLGVPEQAFVEPLARFRVGLIDKTSRRRRRSHNFGQSRRHRAGRGRKTSRRP